MLLTSDTVCISSKCRRTQKSSITYPCWMYIQLCVCVKKGNRCKVYILLLPTLPFEHELIKALYVITSGWQAFSCIAATRCSAKFHSAHFSHALVAALYDITSARFRPPKKGLTCWSTSQARKQTTWHSSTRLRWWSGEGRRKPKHATL